MGCKDKDKEYFEPPELAEDAPEEYRRFWELWRTENFFECHEVLEELWRATSGEQKLFYNGLIHCAVAIYQHRRGNAVGAARQMLRAQIRLGWFRPEYRGVNVDNLLESVEREITLSQQQLSKEQIRQLAELEHSLQKRIQRDYPHDKLEAGAEE